MVAVLAGLAAAALWASANLASSRTSRAIGAPSALAWVMLVGLALNVVAIVATQRPGELTASILGYFAVAGAGNVLALLLGYTALRLAKVAVVTAIISTEGAVASLIAIVAGERLAALAYLALALLLAGVFLASLGRDPQPLTGQRAGRATLLACAAALVSGASFFAAGRVSGDVPLVWAVLPPRAVGAVALALPLFAVGRLVVRPSSFPLLAVAGIAEVLGFWCFAFSARASISVAAILSSLFAAFAAVGAWVLFGERLCSRQVLGVAMVVVGLAVLSYATV